MLFGQRTMDTTLKERMAQIQPNKCCSLIYTVSDNMVCDFIARLTGFPSPSLPLSPFPSLPLPVPLSLSLSLQSGTSGHPKGVMLSHDNVSVLLSSIFNQTSLSF